MKLVFVGEVRVQDSVRNTEIPADAHERGGGKIGLGRGQLEATRLITHHPAPLLQCARRNTFTKLLEA
jgi:hypothetical protein